MTESHRPSVVNIVINLAFIILSIVIILPFALVVIVSLSSNESVLQQGYSYFPSEWSFEAYQYILTTPDIILQAYGVTILITVIGTVCGLLLTAMTAYSISRSDYRYNRITTFYIFFTMLFGGGLVPFYILITQYLHLKDTMWAMILPLLLNPFNIMVMKGFLSEIPKEIIESAKMDGAREFRIFFTIVLQLSTPALATLGLFISFGYWNEWFNAMLFIDSNTLVPLQLLLVRIMNTIEFLTTNSEFVSQVSINMQDFPTDSARMAIAVLAGGPMLVIFPFFQKYFVKGLTVGSLKG
ncbi:sugar ABC transporter permease [Paenibacillus sp. MY03]|jgi:putative aldouronate transport system permease protein|uniref:carbohydrate ABC transporter permease n=1 Tax=Paenibacillus sp. MY03 TaxID=302980 RepID=UPI000B3D3B9B|nr:carbohydrate ABC transporter permease [Paenibacillus sp. MY03]OUS70793.1 sugar ABC transporter permease [Paenibacillus sp. MY03]